MEYVEMDPPVWYQEPLVEHSQFLVIGTRYANQKTQWVVIIESASGLAVDEIDRGWLHECQPICTGDVSVDKRKKFEKFAAFVHESQEAQ